MNTEEFYIKDNIEIEGITENFIWYESQLLRKELQSWITRFNKLAKVMDDRHKEHTKMLRDVLDENNKLKKQLSTKEKKDDSKASA